MRRFTLFAPQAQPDIVDFLQTFRAQLTSETIDYLQKSVLAILGTDVGSTDLMVAAVKVAEYSAANSATDTEDVAQLDWTPLVTTLDGAKLSKLCVDTAAFATPFFSLDRDLTLHRPSVTIGATRVPLPLHYCSRSSSAWGKSLRGCAII